MENYLEEIILELKNSGIRFIICGGVAAVIHGVERMTADIDLSLAMDDKNLNDFLKLMKKLNFIPRAPVPPEYLLYSDKREAMLNEKGALVFTFIDVDRPFRQIDIFLEKEKSFDILKDYAETINIDEKEIHLISPEKLIEMKKEIKPPRKKDLFDIEELKEILKRRQESEG